MTSCSANCAHQGRKVGQMDDGARAQGIPVYSSRALEILEEI
jgi:hypothetical protein